MPRFEVEVAAKVFIRVEAADPRSATDFLDGLLEDAGISMPGGMRLDLGPNVLDARMFYGDVRRWKEIN